MQKSIIKVAIQGEAASFHEIAATQYYEQPITLVYCRSFQEVFSMLSKDIVDKAFVAISNSNHGEIREVKKILGESNLVIEGEYALPIKQHLIGIRGTDLTKVTKIISHAVALSQCSDYLSEHFRDIELINYYDTSAAVAFIKQQSDKKLLAIAGDMAANLYNLEILQREIQDDPNNTTLYRSFSNPRQPWFQL